ncbi:uncharacterized protein (TIGR02246 family) [Sphingobium sp. B2D3A]|uniref:nuclear transport factor 2 family protein n=1 Tax=unclassified Sphingobium TaxID=2611147 RepID=UPI0022248560|nr:MULTISPECIES: nuclear transport factor 2 family protein [unclassified Sphingobium]MCW2339064.1 uncharacterized protein (TIGR02246 family) [Sphingobium sp. B2D3A]MCW2385489.1 uncharacterized protein (TIGR02246 family) [Sphingobium sp. B2D3D]
MAMTRLRCLALTAVAMGLAMTGNAQAQSLSAEDYAVARAEIVNLSNRLMIASDARDAETYAESFASDGVLDWIGGVEHGREAIRKAIEEWRAQIAKKATIPADAKSQPRTRHYVLNHDITVNPDGKTASGRVYWFALTNNTPQTDVQVLYFGHVIEDYVKEDGKWLFSKRAVFNESRHNRALFYPELGEKDPRQSD